MMISDLNYLEVVQPENIVGGIADIDNYYLDFYEVVDVYLELDVSDTCNCEWGIIFNLDDDRVSIWDEWSDINDGFAYANSTSLSLKSQ